MLVSCIIPHYNREVLALRAIRSILANDFEDYEIILVDDCSPHFPEKIQALLKAPHRLISLKRRSGVSFARNIGARLSRGKHLAFLDSDDEWTSDKLSTQLSKSKNTPISYTMETWRRFDKTIKRKLHYPSGDIFFPSLKNCCVGPSTLMIDKEIFPYFDEDLPVAEDYDLWLHLSLNYPFHLVQKELSIKHAGHGDQLSFSHFVLDHYRLIALLKLLRQKLNSEQREATLVEIKEKCRILSLGAKKRNPQRSKYYEKICAELIR